MSDRAQDICALRPVLAVQPVDGLQISRNQDITIRQRVSQRVPQQLEAQADQHYPASEALMYLEPFSKQ